VLRHIGAFVVVPTDACGQVAPNIDNLTLVPLVKSSNIKVKTLKCALINFQSMCNKTSRINDYIVDDQIEVALLTETCLSGCEMDQKHIGDVTQSGYKFPHKARTGKRGGGVGNMYRDDIRLDMHSSIKAKSYQSVHVTPTVGGSSVH